MKRLVIGAAAIAIAAPAFAADLPVRSYTKAPLYSPESAYNWSGFYVGGHLGAAFVNGVSKSTKFAGGVQGGFNYQVAPNWLVGAEAEVSGLAGGNNARLFPPNVMVTTKNNVLGSVTGRVGYTWGPGLVYAKAGVGFRDNNTAVTMAGVPKAFTTTGNQNTGYTLGAGIEYMFAPNWSAKAEYQYYNFGNTTFTAGPAPLAGMRFRNDEHAVTAGVNYHFGWGGMMSPKN